MLDLFILYALATAATQVRSPSSVCGNNTTTHGRCTPCLAFHVDPCSLRLGPARPQFVYVLLVGTFPFNSVLAGMLSSLGFLTLTGVL